MTHLQSSLTGAKGLTLRTSTSESGLSFRFPATSYNHWERETKPLFRPRLQVRNFRYLIWTWDHLSRHCLNIFDFPSYSNQISASAITQWREEENKISMAEQDNEGEVRGRKRQTCWRSDQLGFIWTGLGFFFFGFLFRSAELIFARTN